MSRSAISRSATPRRGRRVASALVLAGALASVSACGGSMDSSGAAPTSAEESAPATSSAPGGSAGGSSQDAVRSITATEDDFSISLGEQDLSAGSYEIEVVNNGSATHDLVVERDGEDVAFSETLAPGKSATVTVDLEAGEYVFYCSIGNHRAMGMEVTVRVA